MGEAEEPDQKVDENDISGDQGVTDPEPAPVEAEAVPAKYHDNAATAGKLLFDSPKGSMVCSATVVKDPANPGKSNMVWTAGHCVHAGKSGGWYRNIAFVPSYNDADMPAEELQKATKEEIAPYGVWWGDWAQTSDQWIEQGGATGGDGAPYDFAVIHVTPEEGSGGKSLEEMVGSALPVDFNAPAVPKMESMTAIGYPAAPPYDGQKLFRCEDKPGRLSITDADPTMYRIGCTMTGGSSGGGWVATGSDGKPALVSNTSIGPITAGWLAGPRLGKEAKAVFDEVSGKFAGR
jgi:V8-like Glu-specific endopeptidase